MTSAPLAVVADSADLQAPDPAPQPTLAELQAQHIAALDAGDWDVACETIVTILKIKGEQLS